MHIAICGSAPSSVHTAPVRDASYTRFTAGSQHAYPPLDHSNVDWDIWGCSPGLFGVAERVNRWFEVHRWEPGKEWFSPQYCQWLREFRGIVYTGRKIDEIPGSVEYPLARVENEFGPYFLTSSLSLMFAIAILEIEEQRAVRLKGAIAAAIPSALEPGTTIHHIDVRDGVPDTIGLFGVDMSATEEYEYQRPGCQFFILEALRRGIRVYVPPESDILRPLPIYGITEWDDEYIKATARARELNRRLTDHRAKVASDTNMAQYLSGACDNLNYFIKTWMGKYALPAGVYISQEPGTGLGGSMTMLAEDTKAQDAVAARFANDAVTQMGDTDDLPDTLGKNTIYFGGAAGGSMGAGAQEAIDKVVTAVVARRRAPKPRPAKKAAKRRK